MTYSLKIKWHATCSCDCQVRRFKVSLKTLIEAGLYTVTGPTDISQPVAQSTPHFLLWKHVMWVMCTQVVSGSSIFEINEDKQKLRQLVAALRAYRFWIESFWKEMKDVQTVQITVLFASGCRSQASGWRRKEEMGAGTSSGPRNAVCFQFSNLVSV